MVRWCLWCLVLFPFPMKICFACIACGTWTEHSAAPCFTVLPALAVIHCPRNPRDLQVLREKLEQTGVGIYFFCSSCWFWHISTENCSVNRHAWSLSMKKTALQMTAWKLCTSKGYSINVWQNSFLSIPSVPAGTTKLVNNAEFCPWSLCCSCFGRQSWRPHWALSATADVLLLEQEGGFFQSQYSALAPALKQANNSTYLLNFKLKCLEYPLHKTLEASCTLSSHL